MNDVDTIIVVAAVIENDGKILIARRKKGMYYEHKWEFPGGKVEAGETREACLRRELKEELGIDAAIGEFVGEGRHAFGCCGAIELKAYRASWLSGDFHLVDHDEIRWVLPSELADYDFPEADKPILRKLMEKE
jgi:8-oxo-dGTP diphosphatase